MMAVESHDHSIFESDVVSCVHSAGTIVSISSQVASDSSARQTTHSHHSTHSANTSLFDAAHVRSTCNNCTIMPHPFSCNHVGINFSMVSSLELAVWMVPASCDSCSNVVQCFVTHVVSLRIVRSTPRDCDRCPSIGRSTRKID